MPTVVVPVTALLIGVGLLFIGNGLLNSLVPLKAEAAGFSPLVISALGSSYFAGYLLGCLLVPGLVRRIGHIRAFSAFAALATMTAILHSLFEHQLFWALLRLSTGFAAAALYMIIESWLNARSDNTNRGTVMGAYVLVNLGALAAGQQFLPLAQENGGPLFMTVALLTIAAILPITLTRHDVPQSPPAAKLPLHRLMALSPLGVVGCFLTGVSNGPFWTLGTSYAQKVGLSLPETAQFMALPIIAGALCGWPIGLLSDRVDRRLVIMGAWLGVLGVCTVIGILSPGGLALLILMTAYGAMVMPINSLYVAHVNDSMENGDRIAISSGLILLYGIGAMLGPLVAGSLMTAFGPAGLFLHIGCVAVFGAAYAVHRLRVTERPPEDQREPFQLVTRTTQGVAPLDPRGS